MLVPRKTTFSCNVSYVPKYWRSLILSHVLRYMIPKFLLPVAIWCAIQIIKVFVDFSKTKSLHRSTLWSAGGFPSVHSGIAASITTVMRFEHGVHSTAFALAFCFSFLFRYDAANIRYEAGQHAKFIKRIGEELEWILDIGWKTTLLKERLWHTFFEVIGGILIWTCMTIAYYRLHQHYSSLFEFLQ